MPSTARRAADPPGPRLARDLLRWFSTHRRPLPWRRSADPYRIWVAEVLLQQTRVAQADAYYDRFLARFPTVGVLARAPLSSVLKAWQGAGYYARARHLHAAAREVVRRYDGQLPRTVEELETLPGFGPYISRAVASLAYGAPVVALEANGVRLAARWWAETGDVRTARIRYRLSSRLESILPRGRSGAFNEAVMELGETVCHPRTPDCPRCPVRRSCRAFATLADPGALPSRIPRRVRPHLVAAVAVVESPEGRLLVQRRPESGLLGGLFEFPGGKVEAGESVAHAVRREWREETGLRAPAFAAAGSVRHAYSHFSVELHVFRGRMARAIPPRPGRVQRWVTPRQLRDLPLPRATEKILDRLRIGLPGPRGSHRGARASVTK